MYCSSMVLRLSNTRLLVRRWCFAFRRLGRSFRCPAHVDYTLATGHAGERLLFVFFRIVGHVGYAGNGGVLLNGSDAGLVAFHGKPVAPNGGCADWLNVVPTGISGGPRNVGSAST